MEWVKAMLMRWGESVASGGRRIGGSASMYPAYQLVHIRSTSAGEPPVDMNVMFVDQIMADLKKARPPLYQAAYDVYVSGLSIETTAGRQKCARRTVYSRLDSLYVLIANKASERHARIATTNA